MPYSVHDRTFFEGNSLIDNGVYFRLYMDCHKVMIQ
jgi:hypothetical protein